MTKKLLSPHKSKVSARRSLRRPPPLSRGTILLERLLRETKPSFSAWHAPEPRLIFAGRQRCEDPKTGLTLFGPAGLDKTPRQTIRLGVIGTGDTIQQLLAWLETARLSISAGANRRGLGYDPLLAPDFPGFSHETVFQCAIETGSRFQEVLTEKEIEKAIDPVDFSGRVKGVVDLVASRLAVLADREPAPDVVVCAMPEIVDLACGPQGRADRQIARALTKIQRATQRLQSQSRLTGQLLLGFGDEDDEITTAPGYWDFHNALKVRAMNYSLPTQLVWESTLTGSRNTQDPATIAWNFFTAIYYKAGNIPWELDFDAGGTCFIGVTFYRESPDPQAMTRTSLAQVFSETGEGLVLKGEPVRWDKDRDRRPHLSEETSTRLVTQALAMYEQHFGRVPERVVIHKTSRYWPEELRGFRVGLGRVKSFDFLALDRRGIRFLRLGKEPPVRGTVIELARRNYLIYTRGYVPFLRAYPGMRVPNPLEVIEHHGDSTAEKVCSEILALTKLNWNNCGFASGSPITTAFSKQVGRILTELPNGQPRESKYRFFM